MKNIPLYFYDDDNHIVCRVYSIDTLAPFVTIALSVEKLVNINLINVLMDTVYF